MAHIIVGSTIGLAFAPEPKLKSVMQWSALGSVVSLVPDLDILLTLTGAHWEDAHRTATHSLVMVAIICLVVAATRRYRLALMIFVVLSVHLLMDLFCQDVVPPYGLSLFWPFWDTYIYFDFFIFFSAFTPEKSVLALSDFIWVMAWEFFVALLLMLLIALLFGRNKTTLLVNKFSIFMAKNRNVFCCNRDKG